MNGSKLARTIKRLAVTFGLLLLLISMYLSFDGFDGEVSGSNTGYSAIGILIGFVFAVTVTIIQFIFTNDYKKLNPTLVVIGVLSYVYSIYTNKLGAHNLLHMSDVMAWITAGFADIVAEPMIAWGLGESLVGDLLGNLWNVVGGEEEKPRPKQHVKSTYKPKHKPAHLSRNRQFPAKENLMTARDLLDMRRERK
jgi:hypothetical protein